MSPERPSTRVRRKRDRQHEERAALDGVLAGDHVVVADVTYEATWRLWRQLLPEKYGIEATFVDASDPDAVRGALRPNTRLVHVETIGNPTTKVADVAAIAGIAPSDPRPPRPFVLGSKLFAEPFARLPQHSAWIPADWGRGLRRKALTPGRVRGSSDAGTRPATTREHGGAMVSRLDEAAAERAVRDFLAAVGLDPERPELQATPARVARAAAELFAGVGEDPVAALGPGQPLPLPRSEPVAVTGIPFASICEHHLLPFHGTASIVYLPGERLAGVGGFDAALTVLAARPQLQERLTAGLADAVTQALGARGALVVTRAEHACMRMRGSRTVGAVVTAVSATGAYADDPAARAEALALADAR